MPSNDDEHRPGLAGRAAFFPARKAARVWRDQFEAAADDVLSAPEIQRVIDRALAGSLPEEIARSLVRHRVIERVVRELAASGELERLVEAALATPKTLELTDRLLASEETQHALRQIASSPEIRAAITQQTAGLAVQVVGGVRASAARLDDRIERAFRRRERAERPVYAGIATRALALAIDALTTLVLYFSALGIVALISSLVGGVGVHWLVGAPASSGWFLAVCAYFVILWSAAGQTLGMRLLRLRVRGPRGGSPSVGRSIVRFIGLAVSIAVLFLGFVPVLFDRRRRGLADYMARTVVEYDDPRAEPTPP